MQRMVIMVFDSSNVFLVSRCHVPYMEHKELHNMVAWSTEQLSTAIVVQAHISQLQVQVRQHQDDEEEEPEQHHIMIAVIHVVDQTTQTSR